MRLPSSFYTRAKYTSLDASTAADMLQTWLRKLRLDLTLSAFAKLWEELVEDRNQPEEKRQLWPAVQPHQLAYLSMASICASNDHRTELPSRDALFHLTNLYNQAQGQEIIALGDEAGLADWERFFLRTSYQQFTHQARLRPEIERSLHLFNVVARRPEIARVFDISGEFAHAMGLSIENFMRIGLATFALTGGGINAGRFFELADLARQTPSPMTSVALEQFLSHAASTYVKIRDMAATTSPAKPEYEFYRFNPLEALPVVRTDRSGYVVPFPPYIVHRITRSLYYDLMAVNSARFPVAFGVAFEAYLGELLATAYGDRELFSERVYCGKEEQKSTDWVVIEGTAGTLIECKVARLSMETKVSADPESLRRDLVKGRGPSPDSNSIA
jgi:hypothetical protein